MLRRWNATCVSIILILLWIEIGTADSPRPGIRIPEVVKQFFRESQSQFSQSNLVKLVANQRQTMRSATEFEAQTAAQNPVMALSFPVLVGKFSDSGEDPWAAAFLQRELFDGPWSTGTMRDYYLENSNGQFDLGGQAYGWYQVAKTREYYGNGDYGLSRTPWFIQDLLFIADPAIDFSRFDNDGDGVVETLIIVHYGQGAESSDDENDIWSHSSRLFPAYQTDDGVQIKNYIVQPAISSRGDRMIEIGVFCHEFGHALGLPDLYDIDDTSEGIGEWGLMGSGSWGGDGMHPESPASLCAWSREVLGWVTPTVITQNEEAFQIAPVNTKYLTYKLWKEGSIEPYFSGYSNGMNVGREYFLVEYRQKTGFDRYNHIGGLLVWHIDNQKASNTDESHPLVDLEEADGKLSARGDPGDPFPGSSGNRRFDNWTTPSSLAYNLANSNVALINISDPDSVIRLDIEVVEQHPLLEFASCRTAELTGNNDGIPEAGETIALYVALKNIGADLIDATGQLSTDDGCLSLLTDTVIFDDIPIDSKGSNSQDAFIFRVNDSTRVHLADFSVDISLEGSDFRQAFDFQVLIGHPEIFVIDDDDSPPEAPISDFSIYYTSALDSLDRLYEYYNVRTMGFPTVEKLLAHDMLIWFTGNSTPGLNELEILRLSEFMDAGKKLLLSGENIAKITQNTSGQAFFRDYLHAELVEEMAVVPYFLLGTKTDPFFEGSKYVFNLQGSAQNQTEPDVIMPMNGATGILEYIPGNESAAIKYDGIWKVVYLGFGFEAISSAALNGPVGRADLMARILTWFDGNLAGVRKPLTQTAGPQEYALEPCYPNPFIAGSASQNSSLSFRYHHPKREKVILEIYDILGRSVNRFEIEHAFPGTHQLNWDGKDRHDDFVASGIYVLVLKAPGVRLVRKFSILK
ncbi:M6 family metalloprotease domain-containing protein [candidate division KSB1 bacterium]|nr:M6 family metalloprotease domain-containing protein [candidate division KSB1 bacterium]